MFKVKIFWGSHASGKIFYLELLSMKYIFSVEKFPNYDISYAVFSQLFPVSYLFNFSLISLKFSSYFAVISQFILISQLFLIYFSLLTCFSLISQLFLNFSLVSKVFPTCFSIIFWLFLSYVLVVLHIQAIF